MSEAEDMQQETKKPEGAEEKTQPTEESPTTTHHSVAVGGKALNYTVNTGLMPLKNDKGEIEANMFYMAYTLDGQSDPARRPLCFVFNGGPGSSSVWLHLGTCGPRRVKMENDGWMPKPPFELVDNEHTWLDMFDLVFIDPVGTGYSRAVKEDDNKKYWSPDGDIESVGEFIRMYLTRNERWRSPLFLAGESYGTTRAAGLAGHLFQKGVALNGIILISTILNMQTARFIRGNDLPFALFVPTYAATAWYHGQLVKELQKKPIAEFLQEVEHWVTHEYSLALMKGDALTADERQQVTAQLARYTGLDADYVEKTNLRIQISRFCKELLRDQKRTVGRLDSRFKGRDALAVTEMPEHDPSYSDIIPPYTALFNDYVRRELGYKTDREYQILSFKVNQGWDYAKGVFLDTSEALRSALAKNPHMHVLVARGYYDMATPHFAAQYTFDHMDIDPEVKGNIHYADYEAGHMLYLEVNSLGKLKDDVKGLLQTSLA